MTPARPEFETERRSKPAACTIAWLEPRSGPAGTLVLSPVTGTPACRRGSAPLRDEQRLTRVALRSGSLRPCGLGPTCSAPGSCDARSGRVVRSANRPRQDRGACWKRIVGLFVCARRLRERRPMARLQAAGPDRPRERADAIESVRCLPCGDGGHVGAAQLCGLVELV